MDKHLEKQFRNDLYRVSLLIHDSLSTHENSLFKSGVYLGQAYNLILTMKDYLKIESSDMKDQVE